MSSSRDAITSVAYDCAVYGAFMQPVGFIKRCHLRRSTQNVSPRVIGFRPIIDTGVPVRSFPHVRLDRGQDGPLTGLVIGAGNEHSVFENRGMLVIPRLRTLDLINLITITERA